jgi:hypothetical protein
MDRLLALLVTLCIGLLVLHCGATLALRSTPYSAPLPEGKTLDLSTEQDDIGSWRLVAQAILSGLLYLAVITSVLTLIAHPQWWSWPASQPRSGQSPNALPLVAVWLLGTLLDRNVLRDRLKLGRKTQWVAAALLASCVLLWEHFQGWPLVDLVAALLALVTLLAMQFRQSFLRLSLVLTLLAGLYDAVQVYGTGNMVKAANLMSGLHTPSGKPATLPLLIIVPSTWSWQSSPAGELGVGDVLVSGLLVIVAARLSRRTGQHWLYRAALVGFSLGLVTAWTVVFLTNSAQPATIYLVPAITGAVCWAARRTGTWSALKAKPYAYLPPPASKTPLWRRWLRKRQT